MRMAGRAARVLDICACLLAWHLSPDVAQSADPVVAEKWADPNLTVTAGLELWLDASRQNTARRIHQLAEIANDQPLDTWYDGSGHARHLVQKDGSARPGLSAADGHPAVRFDGRRQHLTLSGPGQSFKDATIFVVAAPFANPGDFRAFLAMNQAGQNDYTSGLTLDMTGFGTPRFQTFNAEGAGFGGAVNLMRDAFDFGTVCRLCVTSTAGTGGTKLYVNGKLHDQRDRAASILRMDQFTLGARFYTNGGSPQIRGFFDGDIVEVLVYNRVLTEAERGGVDKYLTAKHGDLRKVALPRRPGAGKPLVSVPPPPVQVFVPGFTVKQVPIDLTNVNNVRYRADGKLVALAYDGNVYLLSDSDGDGLEDKVELFWDNKGRLRAPIGMALTPPGHRHGNGLFVASKGKCSLLVDTDGDDKADKEIIVASGWQEIPHGVDAVGVAVDPRDGSVYFGLGAADYTNPYLLGKDGQAHYRLDSERGTILRVAPDFTKREIVCTGVRFPVGMAFNRAGDLFCTDQEGATWLPNGNPLDELLHLQPGRHYGFPPRHPKHLPGVLDEPSVFDYSPQHQSTCGLCFDESVNGGPLFGPVWWRGDALVTGYSRGKLYRTTLVKTEAGYVARNQLLAALNMLAVDACVSPRGDLVVAVHGGGPDWGSGPSGKGKLYKLMYTGKDLPQPVLAWPQGPREVRIAFDRPLDPQQLRNLTGRTLIEYGAYVSAGDRFEFYRPGYQAVQDQLLTPRFDLPVHSVQVTRDRRTLILATAPHPAAAGYALTLPGLGRPATVDARQGELPQLPETDLHYDLCGVEAMWQARTGDAAWTGWLPHLDLGVARQLTSHSAFHDELWAHSQQAGKLVLRTQLDLWHILRPAVQPGAKIDYEWPAEDVTLDFRAKGDLAVKGPGTASSAAAGPDGFSRATLTVRPNAGALVPTELTLTSGGAPAVTVMCHTNEDPRPRALPLHRFLLPWAVRKKEEATAAVERDIPELHGGNWQRGRRVFFSEQAGCFKCHTLFGAGGALGPNLSNLAQRDYASVLRDIAEPSFAINPDYITHVLALKDGRVLTGSVRTEGDRLQVGDSQGKVTTLRRAEVETMTTAPTSIMPEGLPKLLGPERLRDLLTFLLTPPPRMPDYGTGTPPPPRSLKEVATVLAGAPANPPRVRPLHVVLVTGKKDHGPGEHDYPAWQKIWQKLLALAEETKVTAAVDWPAPGDLKSADVLVFYQQGQWTPQRARDIDAYLARGGGLVYIHYAVDGGADAPGFAQRIGLAWRGGQSKFRHGPLDLGFETGPRHPIARNFDKLHFHDESYWALTGDPQRVNLLATGMEDGQPQLLFWTLEPSKGRVFVSIPGHFAWTFDDPLFRILLLRGLAWTAREPVDRFNDLASVGARIKE